MFYTESELVDFFIEKQSKKKNRIIVTELATNYGRPDIVEIVYSERVLQIRRDYVNKIEIIQTERIDSYILTFLYGKSWIKTETILRNMNINKLTLNRALERLELRGLLLIFEGKIKLNRKSNVLAIKQLNVYEAKLSNWKYVIEQAERHLWFSNNSSILLPELSDQIFKKCYSACEKRGIGLILANEGKLNKVHAQTSKALINTPLLWELNEKLIDGSL